MRSCTRSWTRFIINKFEEKRGLGDTSVSATGSSKMILNIRSSSGFPRDFTLAIEPTRRRNILGQKVIVEPRYAISS